MPFFTCIGITIHTIFSFYHFLPTGGALGTAYARYKYKGKSQPISELLIALPSEKRDELHTHCESVRDDYSTYEFNAMSRLITEDGELRERMLQCLKSFVKDNLKQPLYEEIKQRGKAE